MVFSTGTSGCIEENGSVDDLGLVYGGSRSEEKGGYIDTGSPVGR